MHQMISTRLWTVRGHETETRSTLFKTETPTTLEIIVSWNNLTKSLLATLAPICSKPSGSPSLHLLRLAKIPFSKTALCGMVYLFTWKGDASWPVFKCNQCLWVRFGL